MSFVHNYHEARHERLVRLGVRPCLKCEALRSALAGKDELIERQRDKIEQQAALLGAQLALVERQKIRFAAESKELELVKEVSSQLGPDSKIRVEDVIEECCTFYKIERDAILSQRRDWNVVRPRHMAIYLARRLTTRSQSSIGRTFSNRDHTTILNASRRIEALVQTDEKLKNEVEQISLNIRVRCARREVTPSAAGANLL